MPSYSFKDVTASVVGTGGFVDITSGAAEEGITFAPVDDKNIMAVGADGTPQHSLRASTAGTCTVRLLKTSPSNAILQAMFTLQSLGAGDWGQNAITVRNIAMEDLWLLTDCAFKRQPDLSMATDGGTVEWVFDVGRALPVLGIA